MKSFIAVLALCLALAASPTWAQGPLQSRFGGAQSNSTNGGMPAAPRDDRVVKSGRTHRI